MILGSISLLNTGRKIFDLFWSENIFLKFAFPPAVWPLQDIQQY